LPDGHRKAPLTSSPEDAVIGLVQAGQVQTVFFSAAEASGDNHAGKVVELLRRDTPEVNCVGLGGEAMAGAGCNLLENLVDKSAMLTDAFVQVGFYWKLLQRVKRYLRQEPPEAVVLVDSPAWNFHVAYWAKKLDIPVLYYIAPQLWAWGGWRIGKLRRRVDEVACILPFEQQWLQQRGVKANYVGHPLFDDNQQIEPVSPWLYESKVFPTVTLLPGSRRHEIARLWPVMQEIACRIKQEYPDARFQTTAANAATVEILTETANKSLCIDIRQTSIEAVTRHVDLTLVASGTATLEVAAQNCPMVVMYYVHPLQWHLVGRWMVKTKYLSLVNILADKELVPEFMPFSGKADKVADTALELLADEKARRQMREALQDLLRPMMQGGASAKVAAMVRELMGQTLED